MSSRETGNVILFSSSKIDFTFLFKTNDVSLGKKSFSIVLILGIASDCVVTLFLPFFLYCSSINRSNLYVLLSPLKDSILFYLVDDSV